jgi:hypothetical protein
MTSDNNTDDLAKDLYEKIVKDIESTLDSRDGGHYTELVDLEKIKPVTTTGHEIVFDVKGIVFTENEKGQLTQTKEVIQKTYHIPVPPNVSYSSYSEAFFGFFEKTLSDIASNTNKEFDYDPTK